MKSIKRRVHNFKCYSSLQTFSELLDPSLTIVPEIKKFKNNASKLAELLKIAEQECKDYRVKLSTTWADIADYINSGGYDEDF